MIGEYGTTTDHDYSAEHVRQKIDVWTGPWFHEHVATGLSLADGFMLTTYNGDKVRVSCPSPRDDENYTQVDAAIADAMKQYEAARGSVTIGG